MHTKNNGSRGLLLRVAFVTIALFSFSLTSIAFNLYLYPFCWQFHWVQRDPLVSPWAWMCLFISVRQSFGLKMTTARWPGSLLIEAMRVIQYSVSSYWHARLLFFFTIAAWVAIHNSRDEERWLYVCILRIDISCLQSAGFCKKGYYYRRSKTCLRSRFNHFLLCRLPLAAHFSFSSQKSLKPFSPLMDSPANSCRKRWWHAALRPWDVCLRLQREEGFW